MTPRTYTALEEVVLDPSFPDLDLALRRGRHIDREDFAWYTLLTDAQDLLETFYRRYGCELVHKTDGYFYLLPTGEKLSRRQLGPGDMLVGQALALMYLDPSTIERGGRVTTEDVVAQLAVVLGAESLVRAFHTKKKRYDERVAQKAVRTKVADGIRHLAALGFVDIGDESLLRLRPALLRFAEPVRGLGQPAAALAKLVAEGEIALVTEDAPTDGESDAARDDDRDEVYGQTEAVPDDDDDDTLARGARDDVNDDHEAEDDSAYAYREGAGNTKARTVGDNHDTADAVGTVAGNAHPIDQEVDDASVEAEARQDRNFAPDEDDEVEDE